jgi:hypothetical protein
MNNKLKLLRKTISLKNQLAEMRNFIQKLTYFLTQYNLYYNKLIY